MSISSKLGKASSFFFFTGFVLGKLQNLPIPIFSTILNIVSLLFYLTAYAFWFISSHFHPNHAPQKNEWYGFAQFKEQYLYASAIGLVATSLSLAAFMAPALLVPAAWLFLCSNLMWSFAEYHKFYNPPTYDEEYSESYQETYLSYAMTMTSMSTVTAISLTLILFIPAITLPVLVISTILALGLGLLAAENWMNFNFGNHKPLAQAHSHTQMSLVLGNKLTHEETNSTAPYHGNDLFKSLHQVSPQRQIQENSLPTHLSM